MCVCVCVVVDANTIELIRNMMTVCEDSRSIFMLGGACVCPTTIMAVSELTEAELTTVMSRHQPTPWTDPSGYCGEVSLECPDPNCIPLTNVTAP